MEDQNKPDFGDNDGDLINFAKKLTESSFQIIPPTDPEEAEMLEKMKLVEEFMDAYIEGGYQALLNKGKEFLKDKAGLDDSTISTIIVQSANFYLKYVKIMARLVDEMPEELIDAQARFQIKVDEAKARILNK